MLTLSRARDTLDSILVGNYQSASITFSNVNNSPVLVNNTLSIQEGESLLISSNNLLATDLDNDDSSLLLFVSNVQYGQFEDINIPGVPITSFIQQKIIDHDIRFVSDGSPHVPSYDVVVSDGLISTSPSTAVVIFNFTPQLTSNSLTIEQGQTVVLLPNDLSAIDQDSVDINLRFMSDSVQHGRFEVVANSEIAISNFTQKQVIAGHIQFEHDGTEFTPTYNITVSDGKAISALNPANVSFSLFGSRKVRPPSGGDGPGINPTWIPVIVGIAGGLCTLGIVLKYVYKYFEKKSRGGRIGQVADGENLPSPDNELEPSIDNESGQSHNDESEASNNSESEVSSDTKSETYSDSRSSESTTVTSRSSHGSQSVNSNSQASYFSY